MAMRPKKNPVTKIAGKIAKEVAKKVTKKSAAKSTAKGLKAAQGPAKYPKGYKPDTAGRKAVDAKGRANQNEQWSSVGQMYFPGTTRKKAYTYAAKDVDSARSQAAMVGDTKNLAPKNTVSKSGRTANKPVKSKAKKSAKVWAAGAAGTSAWVGNEMARAYKKSKKKK
jgi:hypothetical protein